MPRPSVRVHDRPKAAEPDQLPATGRLERLIFLSDGVFAIAMTLLVVELALPEVTSTSSADLSSRLLALGPKYLSYAVSFLVVASYWASHQRIFSHVIRVDGWMVFLNVLLLLFIAFQPFPTTVLGTYGDEPLAVTFYAATLAVTGVIVLMLWLYATSGHRLVAKDLNPRLIKRQTWRALSGPVVFLISIPISQTNPTLAKYSWVALAAVAVVLQRLYRDAT